ncbi:transcription factor S-II, central domain-containing protein [Syncephalis plumigaleata]|nr:transcription factor S-II, central domain-containing protein [Syncephalis plumigaleata]
MDEFRQIHDPVRRSCARLLANALRGDDEHLASVKDENIMKIAVETEHDLFERAHRQVTPEYKTTVRSRIWNLRNTDNVELRDELLNGQLTPYRFAHMTDEEMSNEKERKAIQQLRQETLRSTIGRDHILPMAIPDAEEPMERWPINELEYEERDQYPGESQT